MCCAVAGRTSDSHVDTRGPPARPTRHTSPGRFAKKVLHLLPKKKVLFNHRAPGPPLTRPSSLTAAPYWPRASARCVTSYYPRHTRAVRCDSRTTSRYARAWGLAVTVATSPPTLTVLPKPPAERERLIFHPGPRPRHTPHSSLTRLRTRCFAPPHRHASDVSDVRCYCGRDTRPCAAWWRSGDGDVQLFGFSKGETTPLHLQLKKLCPSRATQSITTVHGPSRIAVLGNLHRQSRTRHCRWQAARPE